MNVSTVLQVVTLVVILIVAAMPLIIDLLVPGLLQSKLSPRHKFRYFLRKVGINICVLKDQTEWMELREVVGMESPVDPWVSYGKDKIEHEVLSIRCRSDNKE